LGKKISQIFNIISDFWSTFLDEDSSSFYGGEKVEWGWIYWRWAIQTFTFSDQLDVVPKGVYGTIITFSFFCCCCWKIDIYDFNTM